ncbi:disease resistance protein RPV1-like [Corylus avellana]|uniref:disease resistance protein RPV1-like n=1 Tax=Corylus avellana TaxID=13451 RepID=UPI00286CBE7A|nr:disease resistance protein RPV1-like [Corylus avellana]
MVSHTYLNVTKYPVGLESRVRDINVLLSIGMNDKRMVGIFGGGGIGKTTIAKAIYNSIAYQFEDSCFLANVRENSKRECGLVQLQETLLSDILGNSSLKIRNVDGGINIIKERLCNKRILLVLDDVDELIQLESLSGEHEWFGMGSRIIITTRDEHLLINPKVDFRYKMNELNHNEAFQLFSQHAFQSNKPTDDFVELTKHALHYAGGLPLALTVLVLMHKSLVTIDERNKFDMHDSLQDMGREIVRQESCKEPGKRSRLWFHEDVRHVFEENMGTNKIEGILVDLPERDLICLSSKTFEKMTRLRLFINRNARFFGSPRYLSNELRVLDWPGCPLEYFPSNFHGKKLVILRISNSPLKLPKERFKDFQNMRTMKFGLCKFLTEIPNISRIPNLEVLRVEKCESLVKVHDSVGLLKKLSILRISECNNLITLPRSLKLRSLETLELLDCARLQKFPEIECKMERLTILFLKRVAIKELPPSIVYFTGLSNLYIRDCINPIHLPNSLQLQHLNILRQDQERCSKVVKLPTKVRDERESMLSVVSTEEFEISSSTNLFASPPLANAHIFDDGCSFILFPALRFLDHERSIVKSEFFMALNCFSSLDKLVLSETEIVSLPACIKRFVRLRALLVRNCKQLKEIPELPPDIENIWADGCVSLESFPELSSGLRVGKWIDLSGCYKLAENIGNQGPYNDYFGGGILIPGNKIPAWFSHRMENPSAGGNSCAIYITGLPFLDEIKKIAFCVVFGPLELSGPKYGSCNLRWTIYSKGIESKLITKRDEHVRAQGSNHVWLEYLVLDPFVLEEDKLLFRFNIICYPKRKVKGIDIRTQFLVKSCGVHLIHEHGENAKDHPSLTHVDFYFCFESSDDKSDESSTEEDECDEESDIPECSAEDDDCDDEDEDDCNLESSY